MAEKRIAAFMAGNNPLRTIEPASNRSARGETACPGRSIRMEKLDGIVLDALKQRVLSPDRLPKLLEVFLEQSDASDSKRRDELASLRAEKTNSMGSLNRIYELVEQGLASPTDRDFAGRLTHHRGRIASLTTDIEGLERQLKSSQRSITPEIVGRFGSQLRDGLRGENPALRQAYVRLLIDQVVVEDDQIHIRGNSQSVGASGHCYGSRHSQWGAQLCTRMARPERFERPTLRFVV